MILDAIYALFLSGNHVRGQLPALLLLEFSAKETTKLFYLNDLQIFHLSF